ncbi:serine/threonine protein kinase [Haliangium ochraceum DSM 14365]|uniref:Serine/threonine protein kinase n=1 Tax=Haliangium ochraceum (strain DSM 14365 / JCM 11303 / SMP-2) TaxID=502025 RepID=D0LLG8_HALO1|nr:serine/threonine protein kinase [Haliangium ochraceum DSM 14365]
MRAALARAQRLTVAELLRVPGTGAVPWVSVRSPARHSISGPDGESVSIALESSDECIGANTAVAFLDGELSLEEADAVEAHAAHCEECRQHLAALSASDSQADLVPTSPLGAEGHLILERGEKVGRFEVLGRLGTGGMGVVWSAYDRRLERKVALKLLRSPKDGGVEAESARLRLLREAQAMARLSHPGVISVYDVGTYKNEVYIAMELVEGDTLTRWLSRYERPWQDILGKFLEAGTVLAEAHVGGLLHRDFKPDNVLVGSDERVRVMDFGLARSLLFDAPLEAGEGASVAQPPSNILGHPLTRTGMLVGTPRYMAPEQFAGRDTDARTDQFSFCVALYEALYRRHPFEGEHAAAVTAETEVPPPPAGNAAPAWLHTALVHGLAHAPGERFPTMQALLRALAPPPPRPSPLRRAWPAGVLLALALAAYAFAAWSTALGDNARLGGEVAAAQGRIIELERDIGEILELVSELEGRAGEREDLIAELEQRLAAAGGELEQARAALSESRAPAAAAQSISSAQPVRAPRSEPPAAISQPPPAPVGLSRGQLMAPLEQVHRDLAVCFREWLERSPDTRLLLGMRVRVEPSGAPALDKVAGLADPVLRACASGNLLRLRFPAAEAVTLADYKFYGSTSGGLFTRVDVVAALPPEPDDTAEFDESPSAIESSAAGAGSRSLAP